MILQIEQCSLALKIYIFSLLYCSSFIPNLGCLHVCHYEIDQKWCDYIHTHSMLSNYQHGRHGRHGGGTKLH